MAFGRKGERVAKTPTRRFPPSFGGRTVGDQVSRTALENCQISHRWENSSSPRSQRIDQAALARNTKLGGKVCVDAGDDFDGEDFGHRDPPCDGVAQTLFSFGFCLPFIVAYF